MTDPKDIMKLSPLEALVELRKLSHGSFDLELQHVQSDVIIYQLLLHLQLEEIAEVYRQMAKEWRYS